MHNSFWAGSTMTFLFSSWVTDSPGAYFGTCLVTVLLGMLRQVFASVVQQFRTTLATQRRLLSSPEEDIALPLLLSSERSDPSPFDGLRRAFWQQHWLVALAHALLHVISLALAYFNMLIVMTFNIGLFLCLLLGEGVGFVIWGHCRDAAAFASPSTISRDEGCHA